MPRPKPIKIPGSVETLERARKFPLLGCWVMEGWRDSGLTPVVVARQVLDPPDAHKTRYQLKFGHEGKPFFIAGPFDNAKAIIAKLERTAGPGNFDYLITFQ